MGLRHVHGTVSGRRPECTITIVRAVVQLTDWARRARASRDVAAECDGGRSPKLVDSGRRSVSFGGGHRHSLRGSLRRAWWKGRMVRSGIKFATARVQLTPHTRLRPPPRLDAQCARRGEVIAQLSRPSTTSTMSAPIDGKLWGLCKANVQACPPQRCRRLRPMRSTRIGPRTRRRVSPSRTQVRSDVNYLSEEDSCKHT